MPNVKTYAPDEVTVWFGSTRLTGFFDGTHIEIKRDEDAVMKHTGNDGAVTRALNRNKGGSVTVTLTQSADVNDMLSGYAAADEETGAGYQSLFIKDLRGTTLVEAPFAWVKKLPDTAFAKEIQGRAWEFDCAELIMNVGGSVL